MSFFNLTYIYKHLQLMVSPFSFAWFRKRKALNIPPESLRILHLEETGNQASAVVLHLLGAAGHLRSSQVPSKAVASECLGVAGLDVPPE